MSRGITCWENVTVVSPRTLPEAVQALADVGGKVTILAGGTDLFPAFDSGRLNPQAIVLDISRMDEIRGITDLGDSLRFGALVTFSEIRRFPLVLESMPMLAQAAATIGAAQIQNRATLGGNLMNASPAGDSIPVLLALAATVTLSSTEGPRIVPLYSFFSGYRRTVAKSTELLTHITVPKPQPGTSTYFRKVGARRAQTISKVMLAGLVRGTHVKAGEIQVEEIRLGIGSVAPTPLRLFETERLLLRSPLTPALAEAAADRLRREITPQDDYRSTAQYRRVVAGRLLLEFLGGLF